MHGYKLFPDDVSIVVVNMGGRSRRDMRPFRPQFEPLGDGRHDNVCDEAEPAKQQDRRVSQVDLPPSVTVSGASLAGVMIVVPAFAIG